MRGFLGRILTLAGAAIVIYSLFIPVIMMQFPVPPQNLGGGIKLNLDMQVESSLYQLGDKLSDLKESGANLPGILDYLWLIFLGLAVINALLALKPSFPGFLCFFFGILPVALLIVVVQQTASNQELGIGMSGLFDYFVSGFYILLAGTLVIFLGGLITGSGRRVRSATN
jgi:hypothetical protein